MFVHSCFYNSLSYITLQKYKTCYSKLFFRGGYESSIGIYAKPDTIWNPLFTTHGLQFRKSLHFTLFEQLCLYLLKQ